MTRSAATSVLLPYCLCPIVIAQICIPHEVTPTVSALRPAHLQVGASCGKEQSWKANDHDLQKK